MERMSYAYSPPGRLYRLGCLVLILRVPCRGNIETGQCVSDRRFLGIYVIGQSNVRAEFTTTIMFRRVWTSGRVKTRC